MVRLGEIVVVLFVWLVLGVVFRFLCVVGGIVGGGIVVIDGCKVD